MRVTVKLYSDLQVYLRNRRDHFAIDLPDRVDAAALIRALDIDMNRHKVIIGINGELGRLDSVLAEGDEVMLVSPMEGGRAIDEVLDSPDIQ